MGWNQKLHSILNATDTSDHANTSHPFCNREFDVGIQKAHFPFPSLDLSSCCFKVSSPREHAHTPELLRAKNSHIWAIQGLCKTLGPSLIVTGCLLNQACCLEGQTCNLCLGPSLWAPDPNFCLNGAFFQGSCFSQGCCLSSATCIACLRAGNVGP